MKIFLLLLTATVSMLFGAEGWLKAPQSVIDTKHHLEWQDTQEIAEYSDIFKMAKAHCEALHLLEKNDWRLPTKTELVRLGKSKEGKKLFLHLHKEVFWTSQEDANDDVNALTVFSGNGFVSSTDKCDTAYTMCVRTSD